MASYSFATDYAPGTTFYNIYVKTGDVKNAGTDALVQISIYGEKGYYKNFDLNIPNHDDNERNSLGKYIMISKLDLGRIKNIVVNNTYIGDNDGPAWYLDYVNVEKISNGRVWNFPCFRWLASDYRTSRVIYPGKRCAE